MENRFFRQLQLLSILIIMVCSLCFSTFLSAQSFSINYTGVDTLFVGNNCTATLDWGDPATVSFTAESGNKIDTFYINNISGGFQIGDVIRAPRSVFISYYVEDTTGFNEVIQSALRIVIADSIKPVFDLTTLPNDTTYSDANDVPQPPSVSTIMGMDNCGIETIRYNGESTRPTICGSFTRSWAALDTADNITIYTQTITIAGDTTVPVWTTNPMDIDLACNVSLNITDSITNWLAANGNGVISDASTFSVSHDFMGLDSCGLTGNAMVTFTALDECGNSSMATGMINVIDKVAPNINIPAKDTTVFFGDSTFTLTDWLTTQGGAVATDFCTAIDNSDTSVHWSLVVIDTTLSCGDNTTYEAIFAVIDDCGNVDSTSATYSIIDTAGVSITGLLGDRTAACGASNDRQRVEQFLIAIRQFDYVDANGNDLDFVALNYTDRDGFTGQYISSGIPFDNTFIPLHDCTWFLNAELTVRDSCGNLAKDTAMFSFIDTIQPIIAGVPLDTILSCDQVFAGSDMNITATDNCDTSLTIILLESSDTTLSAINITRTWIAVDDCNNSDTASQIITVIDTVAPILGVLLRDTIATCDDIPIVPFFIDATDNCTALEDLVFEFVETSNQLTHPDSCQTYNYTITRTWKVTDAFNNSDSMVQLITVVDTFAPTFTKPIDITISCEFRDSLSITGEPTNLLDNCDTLPNATFVDLVIGGDCVGGGALDTIMRTWTVMDACGNASDSIQRIIIIDTTAPVITGLITDITIQCNGDMVPLPVIGTDITATDNCGNTPIIQYMGDTNTQGSDADSCDFYNYTIIRTWRATDACGNAADFVQNITIVDTIAPTIICPTNMEIASNSNGCTAMVTLPRPVYFDDCTGISGVDSLVMTQNFTNPAGDDINEIPVDTLVFDFNVGGTAPDKTITSDVILTINLNSVDGEGANETFSIIGEDGVMLTTTSLAQAQCGNSTTIVTISAAVANDYAQDSIITIMLSPNGSGTEAINNICTDGNANAVLEYSFDAASKSIVLEYSVDGGAITDLIANPMTTLQEGDHTITYYATDCSGNKDSCSYEIMILDKIAPTFDCPTAIIAYADSNNCVTTVTLPFPSNFVDNCGSFNDYNNTQAEFVTFKTDANAGQVPNDITKTFTLNSPNAIGDGTLTVAFFGDNRDTGEFFNIYGENGILLGTTILGDSLSECVATVSTVFTIPQDTLNAWAADGAITISAIPNLDAVNFSDFINPCNNLNTNQTDGSSVLSLGLNFPTVLVNYSIADTSDIVLSTGMLLSPAIAVNESFQVGTNNVTYTIADASGNTAECVYTVTVQDTLAPIIVCKDNFVVQTNPSGDTTDLTLLVDSLVTSLSDNCGIESVTIVPNKVSCADVGMMTVAITVTDSAGNSTTCQSMIEIGVESITPTFSVGVCNNDALFLFADTTFQTTTASTIPFMYSWAGPNNFTSTDKNPIIPNVGTDNSGNYTLTITGGTGCTSEGTIFININNIDVPLLNTPNNTVCTSEGIMLTTSAANCTNLAYQWFEIINRAAPLEDTVVLVGTSTIPSFNIENPTAGSHSYYLIIECDDCTSLGSKIVSVTAFEVPTAITGAPIINICEGEDIGLSSPLTDQTCTYSWVGPGFTADLPTPAPIANATEVNEGVYTLTVSKNGCISEEAFTVVNITSRPAQPSIANESGAIICEGSELVLKTDVLNANTYNWTNTTTFASFTTTSPELRIDTTKLTDAGMWTVMVEMSNCASMPSEEVAVQIEAKPNGNPFFEGAACDGRLFKLNVNPIIAGAGYEWSDANGTVYFGASPEVPVQPVYTLTITSANGCVTTKVLPIDVKMTPVITTLFDSGDADPCIIPKDTDIQIIADVFPANDGTYTYSWTTPDGNTMAPMPDSILLLPNAIATSVNGNYTLVVNTEAGCKSDPVSTIVETVDIPIPNPVITANDTELCEGQTLMLTATEYPTISAEYRWQITSIMDTVTQSPILVLDGVTPALNGVVTLQVYNGDCPSVGTATLAVSVSSPLAQPMISSPTNFCAGETIKLETTAVPDATYLWEGPNFTATSSTPDIVISAIASVQNNGGYTVQILSNNCTSPKSEPLVLTVNEVPNAPIASNSGDICLANTKDIILFIDEDNTPSGAEYRWYDVTTGDLVAGPNTFKSQIIEATDLPGGIYQFYATQTLDGCESVNSNITEVTIADIPNELAQLCAGDMTICDVDNAVICALAPSQGIGIWTTDDANVIINAPNSPETSLSGLLPGSTYTFFWRLSNGVCGEYSATRLIVEVGVAGAVAKVCNPEIEVCEGNTVNLCANPVPAGFDGSWSQPSSQADLGVTIDDVTASNTTVSMIEPGNPYNDYTFYWTVNDDQGICSGTDTMSVKVYGIPEDIALISDNELISCNGDDAVVTANTIPDGLTGNWSSPNPDIIIATPNNVTTRVSNLSAGMNTLVWSLQSGACVDFSSDEIIVFYEEMPEAMDDVYDIGFSSASLLNVAENDQIFSPDYEISILSAPMNGTAEVTADGQINYTANQNFVGTDFFTYELCNPTCASDCSTAQVELKVGEDASCIVPTIMTPNNDGVNDVFMIPCIETGNFPGNEVIIFNQWGDEIYRSAPYTNDWRGTYNGEDVPAGTYYYVIAFDRNTEPTAGFLVIER